MSTATLQASIFDVHPSGVSIEGPWVKKDGIPHDFGINFCGGGKCRKCGAHLTTPQWPQYCDERLLKNEEPVFSEEVQRLNKTIDSKEEAIERSMGNANERWKTAALDTIVEIAQKTPSFTSDDVLAVLDRLDVKTHDTRALGGIFVQAARLGWIRKTGAYVPSKRPACHSRPILVWESLLHSA